MKTEKFMLDTEDGSIECEIIMTLSLEKNKKNYLIYTDNSLDENQELNIFISSYDPQNQEQLNDITDEQELEKVSNYIDQIWKEEKANE